jgi:hypothetical protein
MYPKESPMTNEEGRQHITNSMSTIILNTMENIQAAADEFDNHITTINVPFKRNVLDKVKDLKRVDTQLLTERVSLLS